MTQDAPPIGKTSRPEGLRVTGRGPYANGVWPQGDGVSWAAAIGDTPDRAVSVLADEESAVTRHGHADGAGPNRGVIHDETGHEVLIFAGRNAVLQVYADHFVAGPFRAVPRPVLGRERIPTVFRGELVAIVAPSASRKLASRSRAENSMLIVWRLVGVAQ